MANTYTGSSTISNQTGMTNLVQSAYDRYVEMALRSQPLIRDIADKRPVQQAMPGSSVVFQIYADLATATSTLTENVDPDAVALSNTSTVTVTLNEYGNAALLTRKLVCSRCLMLIRLRLTSLRSTWLTRLTLSL